MISYTSLYGLFALMSFVSLNALILATRYVQQAKMPPSDADFEALKTEKHRLKAEMVKLELEKTELKAQISQLETEKNKMQTELIARNKDLDDMKRSNLDATLPPSPPETGAAA